MKQEMNMELSPPKSSQEIKGDEAQNSAIPTASEARKPSPTLDAAHTPRPWRSRSFAIYGANGDPAAHTGACGRSNDERIANAQLIVAAVNAYVPHRFAAMDALVDALLQAKETIRIWHGEPAWDTYDSRSPEMRKINAALKLASTQDTNTRGSASGTD